MDTMAYTTIDRDRLKRALIEIRETEGECLQLLNLESILEYATLNNETVSIDHNELDFIFIYL